MWQAILADSAPTLWLPRGASTISGDVDLLFNVILWICIFFFFLVTIMLVVFTVMYRHKPGVTRDTAAGHSTTLELTWTLIPSVIVVFLYYYGFRHYMDMTIEPPNSYEITANGKMWQWSFSYANGHTDNELHIPVDQPVRTVLESVDVIHSLYIPAFRMKKDVVPGRFNRMWFQATDANYAEYVTTVTIGGVATQIAVDSSGKPLTDSADTTPRQEFVTFAKLPQPVQAALTGVATGVKFAPDAQIHEYTMCNGSTNYLANVAVSGQPTDVVVDSNGAALKVSADFSTVPAAAQEGLKALAGGADIEATHPVAVFLDAEPYEIYCAAYCGTNHSTMRSRVIVHRSRADFDRWLVDAASKDNSGTPAERGAKLYRKNGCSQCHTLDGTRLVGPSWKDMWGRTEKMSDGQQILVNKPYVTESILQPLAKIVDTYQPVMPPFTLKDNDIDAIIAFLQSISSHTSAADRAALNAPASQPAGGAATQPAGAAPPATQK